MMKRVLAIMAMIACGPAAVSASLLTNGDFEAGTGDAFTGWANDNTVALEHGGLAPDSNRAAFINSTFSTSNADFLYQGGFNTQGRTWTFDVLFAMAGDQNGNALQLIFNIFGSSSAPNLTAFNNGALNARYPNGHNPTWETVFPSGAIELSVDGNGDSDFDGGTAEGDVLNVHRLRVVGHDYGTTNARFDVTFPMPTCSTALSLTWRWITLCGRAATIPTCRPAIRSWLCGFRPASA